ncbi:MAG: hypothetical protein COB02_06010 [Candidatus Cloacimonadota bacterium]|nr:MAG: hypothetical protein COB02_12080 [Candidatus Cloacimonadota bacterium]PCJ20153.1 MAG: hypothetical protein COB02_06010 [Candidatus Cloacimonadota bacterium]
MEEKLNISEFFEHYKSTALALVQPLLLLSLFFSAPYILGYGLDNTIGLFLPTLIGFLSFCLTLVGLCIGALAPFVFTYMIVKYYLGETIDVKKIILNFDKSLIWPILVVISYQHLITLAPSLLVTCLMPISFIFPPFVFFVFLLYIPAFLLNSVLGVILGFTPYMYFFHRESNLEPLILSFNFVKKNVVNIIIFALIMWALNFAISMAFGSASMMSSIFSLFTTMDSSSFDVSSFQHMGQSEIKDKLMGFASFFRANLIDQVKTVFQLAIVQSLNSVFFLYFVGFLKSPHEFKLAFSTKLK